MTSEVAAIVVVGGVLCICLVCRAPRKGHLPPEGFVPNEELPCAAR